MQYFRSYRSISKYAILALFVVRDEMSDVQ